MSQPSTPFNGAAVDPFLPLMEQQQHLTQAQLEELFRSNAQNQPFLSSNSELLDNLDFTYYNNSSAPISSNPSTNSTPDFSTYSFDQISAAYPTPSQNSPHPYPLELQQFYQSNALPSTQIYDERPLPTRWQTNSTFLRPTQSPQTYVRRRSLSHGDADRLAAVPLNPTFVRLQAPRMRSTTPEDTKKADPYHKHGRSASQGPGPRGRPMKQTSIPYILDGSPLVGGMMEMPIGTPLDMLPEPTSPETLGCHSESAPGVPRKHGNPVFEHMTHPDALARSRQIIQLGVLAVVNRSKVDSEGNDTERILKKLQDVEQYFHGENRDERVLRACAIIREALAEKTEKKYVEQDEDEEEEEGDDDVEVPSKFLSAEECGFYGNAGEGTDLMAMLMKDVNRVDDFGVDDL